jgi:DNA-binding winged helix-turn-helix (wHTH) protein/tetratricopeptide (TPR) repeat protein/TolB-like protein
LEGIILPPSRFGGCLPAQIIQFEEFHLDLGRYELRRGDRVIKLEKSPMELLILLVESQGRLVTREEIIQRLWGDDVFVDTRHGINTAVHKLRTALRDDAEQPRILETVFGKGYRLVCPLIVESLGVDSDREDDKGRGQNSIVSHAVSDADFADPGAVGSVTTAAVQRRSVVPRWATLNGELPALSGARFHSRVLWISALACAVVVGLIFILNVDGIRDRLKTSGRFRPTSNPPVNIRRSVAVLGFKNLSQRQDAAWLSTALAEMLTTELGAGEKLRTISGENVARAKNDLSLADTDAYARDTLLRVRQNLGTDLVLAGSYTDLGSRSGGQVRVDFRIQDAVTGETIASVAEVGTENELFQLIARAGSDLRARIGVSEVSPVDQASVRASYPSTPQATRIYAEGSEKLRLYDAIAAKALLEKAVALDPKYPLAHSALAMAWAGLGYDKRASDEAKTAFELSGNLSREERLLVEGQYRELSKQWPLAIDIYRTVFGFFPDNLEYGLRLAAAQSSGGKPQDALSTLASLRKLPSPLGDDPRIDREESQAFNFLGDYKQQLAAASTTVQKAEVRGARLLVASAQLGKCYSLAALGTNKEARPQCESAKQIYASVGDRNGMAIATDFIAQTFFGDGNLAESKRLDQEALGIFRQTGNRRRMGTALSHLANVTWQEGDLDGALKGYAAALENFQEVGDRLNVAAAKDNLGSVHYLKGDLKVAQDLFQDALAGFREIGSKTSVANALENLAAPVSGLGDLTSARKMLEEALAIDRKQGVKSEAAWGLAGLGDIDLVEGKLDEASRDYNEALSVRTEIGEKGTIAESKLALAILALERGQPGETENRIREAREEFRKEKQIDDEMLADTVLARALVAQHKYAEAQREIEAGKSFVAKSQNRANQFQLNIAEAQLHAAQNRIEEAKRSLIAILAEAKQTGLLEYQFEARLELGELEIKSGKTASGRAHLDALAKDATSKGFLLIARKAAKEPARRLGAFLSIRSSQFPDSLAGIP